MKVPGNNFVRKYVVSLYMKFQSGNNPQTHQRAYIEAIYWCNSLMEWDSGAQKALCWMEETRQKPLNDISHKYFKKR